MKLHDLKISKLKPSSEIVRYPVTDRTLDHIQCNGQVLPDGRVESLAGFETATDHTELEVTTGLGNIVIAGAPRGFK